MRMLGDRRGTSPVIGTVVLIGMLVVVASVVSVYTLGVTDRVASPPPADHFDVETDDSGEWVRLTLDTGDGIPTGQLILISSTPVDIDGEKDFDPGDGAMSEAESFAEHPTGEPQQVDIGDTWTAGEDVYVRGDGDLTGVSFKLVWSSEPIRGQNPGVVQDSSTYVILEFTV